jgi:hypothetical protein
MMLPARELPEEDPRRTGLEGAVGTQAEAPADSGRGMNADKVAQAGTVVEADNRVQAGTGVQADSGVRANDGVPPHEAVQADNEVQADNAAQEGAGMVAYDPPSASAASPVQAASPVGADTAMNAGTPASALSTARGDSVDAAAGREWSEVLAMFVDDPRGSVAEASAIVDEAINAFIAAARGRQASLAASWQAENTDTEQLRMALREYRTFWASVTHLPQSA